MKKKLNNSGFTLVEVLVTIAIIAILIVPILQSFVMTAKINASASRLQNATALAQAIAEEFKAKTLEELIETYGEPAYEDEKIVFENIGDDLLTYEYEGRSYKYFEGAGGERFFVEVELDSSEYSEGVNDYINPVFSEFYGGGEHLPIILKSNILEYDSQVRTGLGITEYEESDVVKATTLTIECEAAEDASGYYDIAIYLEVVYEYAGRTYSPERSLVVSYTLTEDEEIPPIYVCYNTYDTDGSTLIAGTNIYGSSDTLDIVYNYTGNTSLERVCSIYLAQQKTKHSTFDTATPYYAELLLSNVTYTNNGRSPIRLSDAVAVSGIKNKIYTNITNWTGNTLTAGGSSAEALYKMTVFVTYAQPDGDVLTKLEATREN